MNHFYIIAIETTNYTNKHNTIFKHYFLLGLCNFNMIARCLISSCINNIKTLINILVFFSNPKKFLMVLEATHRNIKGIFYMRILTVLKITL